MAETYDALLDAVASLNCALVESGVRADDIVIRLPEADGWALQRKLLADAPVGPNTVAYPEEAENIPPRFGSPRWFRIGGVKFQW